MKKIVILLACLFPVLVQAELYRWLDEQGQVHFGDLPPQRDSADKIDLPGPRPPTPAAEEDQATAPAAPETEGGANNMSSGYRQLAIIQPATGSTVRSDAQTLLVVTNLDPKLRAGHLVTLFLDGTALGPGIAASSVELSGVQHGRHTLQAKVIDATRSVIIASPVVSFVLRQGAIAPVN